MGCARRIGGEIVGCDAVQVYRGLDAATAKPTSEQRRAVPHHLVDVADPEDEFTLADWVRLAETAISEISGRGRVPVIVGGTGMYLRGLLRGLVAAPPVDRRTRERLRAMASRFGAPRMHRWLCRLDPASAARLAPGDTQRILRAIELARSGEGTWSERLARDGTWASGVERYPALKYAVDMDRDRLAERLAARVDAFFAAGLVAEIRTMLDRGVPRTANALKAIGYREVLEALDRGRDPLDAREDIVRNTRRYSRRQRTWFRGEPGIEWLDAGLGADAVSDAIARGWAE